VRLAPTGRAVPLDVTTGQPQSSPKVTGLAMGWGWRAATGRPGSALGARRRECRGIPARRGGAV